MALNSRYRSSLEIGSEPLMTQSSTTFKWVFLRDDSRVNRLKVKSKTPPSLLPLRWTLMKTMVVKRSQLWHSRCQKVKGHYVTTDARTFSLWPPTETAKAVHL